MVYTLNLGHPTIYKKVEDNKFYNKYIEMSNCAMK